MDGSTLSTHWFSGFWNELEEEPISIIFAGRFDEPLVRTAPPPSIAGTELVEPDRLGTGSSQIQLGFKILNFN
jgi:hypothetical protein